MLGDTPADARISRLVNNSPLNSNVNTDLDGAVSKVLECEDILRPPTSGFLHSAQHTRHLLQLAIQHTGHFAHLGIMIHG